MALIRYLIKTYTNVSGLILDPFAGSCVVGAVCIDTSRNYILIEWEQEYYLKGKDWIDNIPEERWGMMAKENMGHCNSPEHKGERYVSMLNSSAGRCNTCTKRDSRRAQERNGGADAKGFPPGTLSPREAQAAEDQAKARAMVEAGLIKMKMPVVMRKDIFDK